MKCALVQLAAPMVHPSARAFAAKVFSEYCPVANSWNSRVMIGASAFGTMNAPAISTFDVAISRRGENLGKLRPWLFVAYLSAFPPEILRVIASHEHFDSVYQLLGRTRIWRKRGPFFYEMNGDAEFVNCAVVFDVPIQSIRFFHDDGPAGISRLFQEGEHFAESRPSASAGGFNINNSWRITMPC